MDTPELSKRADLFAVYVGLELKGAIVKQGWTARDVASKTGHSASALNGWLNGKRTLPVKVLCEACEVIDYDPERVVADAYSRMAVEMGERDGRRYGAEDVRLAREQYPPRPSEPDFYALAANNATGSAEEDELNALD